MVRRLELALLVLAGAFLTSAMADAPISKIKPLEPAEVKILETSILGALEGRTFSVDTGKDGKPAGGKDVVRFNDGLMSTVLCIRFGFQPAPYTVRVEGTKVHFHSEMISPKQGELVFRGHIEGDQLFAEAEWSQARWYWTVNVVLWFDGKQVEFRDDLPAYIN